MRLGMLVMGGALALVVSCGEPFAIVGGTGGSTTAMSGSGGAGTGGTGGGTTPIGGACDPAGENPCGAGNFCKTDDCKTGTCSVAPAPLGSHYVPVCGCDHVLYWNADLAIASGVAFETSDKCDISQIATCAAEGCQQYGDDVYCRLRSNSATLLCDQPPEGYCEKIPHDCSTTNEVAAECGNGQCRRTCAIIHDEKPWFEPATPCAP